MLTLEQVSALARLFERDGRKTWPEFADCIRAAQHGYDCIMIHWGGMWLGIERDGYTHS